jgi:hypothetical protein
MVLGVLWGFLTYLWGSLLGVLWKSTLELLFDKAIEVFKRLMKKSKRRRGSKRPKKSKRRRGSKALVRRRIA